LIIPSFVLGAAIGRDGAGFGEVKAGKIFIFVLFGGFSLVFFGVFTVWAGGVPIYKYAAAVASGVIVSIFFNLMSRRTAYGDQILEKTLGFKEFIKTAERDKLEMMFASDPSFFYRILPYAMVLNVSDQWSSHFDKMTVAPPRWYRGGYQDRTFGAAAFTNTLNSSFNSLTRSMTSSPSSSGSSGSSSIGGFSGGGSGGGGGGSW
jgi:uncharacterized membrane protein YgcG